jgi:hypothetical protein
VEAPEGTDALPIVPEATITSTSMVGLPRESRISLAVTSIISVMISPYLYVVSNTLMPETGSFVPKIKTMMRS